ncbi:hypothetical protein MPER_13152 [Moniliophthora perniciosa FA553]|nr:hypothetical protein MPER_13152 [Moniliophthora perniciosa FA553]
MEASFNTPVATNGQRIQNVWQSPEWHRVQSMFPNHSRNLTFSIYVDWFNPFQNKTRGKKVSCGAVILYCMNLLPDIRFLPQNMFFLCIIPGPHEPDPETISHILQPLIAVLRKLWRGHVFHTFRYPAGMEHRVIVVPLIADLPAIRLVSGFLSHSAIMYCSWCKSREDERADLDYMNWDARNAEEVIAQAATWKGCITQADRKHQAQSTGVRWTPLYDLPYWNPVSHLILGFMHNTLEGILQYHLRDLWNVGPREGGEAESSDSEEEFPEDALEELDSELEELTQESRQYEESLQHDGSASSSTTISSHSTVRGRPAGPSLLQSRSRTPSAFSDARTPLSMAPSVVDTPPSGGSDTSHDSTFFDAERQSFSFSKGQLERIRTCIQTVPLPTYIGRPPGNLGEPKHGSLKAYDYLILFTVIFPLILPEFWWNSESSDYHRLVLNNFGYLVASTNIISAYSTSDDDAEEYMHHLPRPLEAKSSLCDA